MNGKERKWAARDAADERRGNIPLVKFTTDPTKASSPALTRNEIISALFAANEACTKLIAERDEARRERDEARRLACGALASGGWDLFANPDDWGVDRGRDLCMRDFAAERNWDCFKSDHIGGTNEMAPDE